MMTQTTTSPTAVLTDDRKIAPLTLKKYIKDFVLDVLMTLPTSGVILTAADLGDKAKLIAAGFALGSAIVGAAVRTVLRWAQSSD
jgi:hypothetical protein